MENGFIHQYGELIGYLTGVASVIFLAYQLLRERKLEEYKLLQRLEEKFTALLWREEKGIEGVWKPIGSDERKLYDKSKKNTSGKLWPVWDSIKKDSERDRYRFTRALLEIFEQAYHAHRKQWVSDKEIWEKWKGWMIYSKEVNEYIPHVLFDMPDWYTPSFLEFFKNLEKKE